MLNCLGQKKPSLIVLCYHSLRNDNWRFSVNPGMFKKQMSYLLDHFQPLAVNEFKAVLELGCMPDRPAFLLSFDDGYKDIYRFKNFFAKHRLKPIVFVLAKSDKANRPELKTNRSLLKPKDLRVLLKAGWSIGCHSATHPDFSRPENFFIDQEILGAKKELEKVLKVKIEAFAYPKGKYNQTILKAVKKAGFGLAFSTDADFISQITNHYYIPRISVDRSHSFLEFKALLTPPVISLKKLIYKMIPQ